MNKIKDLVFYSFIFIFVIWLGWFSAFMFNHNQESIQEENPLILEEVFVIDAVITRKNTYKTYIQVDDVVIIFEDEIAYKQLNKEINNTVKIGYLIEDDKYVFKGIYI